MAKTESVSDDRLAEIIAYLDRMPDGGNRHWGSEYSRAIGRDAMVYLTELAALRAANSDGWVEPVAIEALSRIVGSLESKGAWKVANALKVAKTALSALSTARPPAKALDGIAVTDEMVERSAKSIAENHWSVDSDFIKAVHVSRTWEYHADDARAALEAALAAR